MKHVRRKWKLELVDFGYSNAMDKQERKDNIASKGKLWIKVSVGHGKGNQLIQKRTKSQFKYCMMRYHEKLPSLVYLRGHNFLTWKQLDHPFMCLLICLLLSVGLLWNILTNQTFDQILHTTRWLFKFCRKVYPTWNNFPILFTHHVLTFHSLIKINKVFHPFARVLQE